MTIQNDYLVFANASSNIESQSAYAADSALATGELGNTLASSSRANKAWRQGTSMAAMIAAFVVQQAGLPMIDNGSITANLANFVAALGFTSPVAGSMRNASMIIASSGGFTANFTADEIIVTIGLGGYAWKLGNFSQSINLSGTGIGGMDVGSPPANSFVGLYAMFNPTTQTAGLMATSAAGSTPLTTAYGGSAAPAGYTASALVSVVPTGGSGHFLPIIQNDRVISTQTNSVLNASSTLYSSFTALSLAGVVPANARAVSGEMAMSNGSLCAMQLILVSSSNSAGIGQRGMSANLNSSLTIPFASLPISNQQLFYVSASNNGSGGGGTPSFTVTISEYSF